MSLHFQTKDLGPLKYFWGIEVAQSKIGEAITQWKYVFDILEMSGLLNYRSNDTLMDSNFNLLSGHGEPLKDPSRYRCLVGKHNYLIVIRQKITFVVSMVN